MRRIESFILVLFAFLAASCSPQPSSPIAKSTALYQTGVHRFEVVAWVSDPDPPQGSRIMLYGSLIKDGVFLGGMAMVAIWPDESQERGVPNCSVQVIYQAGVCIIETKDLPPGVYVPISISFEYAGRSYTGGTGFTPR